jgi:hypothetical protein
MNEALTSCYSGSAPDLKRWKDRIVCFVLSAQCAVFGRQVGGNVGVSLSKYEVVLEQRRHHAALVTF